VRASCAFSNGNTSILGLTPILIQLAKVKRRGEEGEEGEVYFKKNTSNNGEVHGVFTIPIVAAGPAYDGSFLAHEVHRGNREGFKRYGI
jgi:hypothetical protein